MLNRNFWVNVLKIYGFRESDIIDMYAEDVVDIDNVSSRMIDDGWHVRTYTYKGIVYLKGRRY